MATAGEQYILRMIVDVQNDVALKQLNETYRGTTQALGQANRSMSTSAKGSRQLGFAFQSAGFQITDFAVQVQGGVSATRALSQQLPQLLAGFNILTPAFAFGTAAAATFAALLPTLVELFKDTSKEMRSFSEISSDFSDALDKATGNVVQDTLQRYDEAIESATGATRRLLEVQQEYARQDFSAALQRDEEALRALAGALVPRSLAAGSRAGAFASPFGAGADLTGGQSREQIIANNIGAANEDIARSFEFLVRQLESDKITITDFIETLAALQQAGAVGGAGIREILTDGGALIEREDQDSLDAFIESLVELNRQIERQAASAATFRGGIDTFVSQFSDADALIAENDYVQMMQEAEDAREKWVASLDDAATRAFERERKAIVAQADAYARSLLPAAEQYRLELRELQAQVEKFNLSEEQAAALTQKLVEKYRRQGEAVKEMTMELTVGQEFLMTAFDSFDRNFQSFVDGVARGTTDVKDLFKRMAASIIADLARIYATQILTGLIFGGGGATRGSTAGIPTSLNPANYAQGGAFVNGVQKFASGGVVSGTTMFPMSRGMGVMGEAGPEGIFPLGRLPNGDLGVQGAPMNVTINNNAGVEVSATQSETGLTIDIIKAAIASDIARGGNQLSSAIAGSYGLQRAGV